MRRQIRSRFTIAMLAVALAVGFAPCDAAAHGFRLLYSFCKLSPCKDGSYPRGTLAIDGAGNLFGLTTSGGATDSGTIWEIARSGETAKHIVLHSFGAEGRGDLGGGVILDAAGNLYGTTVDPSGNTGGSMFELKPSGKFIALFHFCPLDCADGTRPQGPLTYQGASHGLPYDGISPLYGTTLNGGPYNRGVAYKLTKSGDTWSETVLYGFCSQGGGCEDGSFPAGSLLVDDVGNVYGGTSAGGSNQGSVGVLFKIDASGTETVLHTFCDTDCHDGAFPTGSLVMGADGVLYGTAEAGGAWGGGVVFKYGPNSRYKVLYDFCRGIYQCHDGLNPLTGLVLDPSGNLFGTTGASECCTQIGGSIFEVSSSFHALHQFCKRENCSDGSRPDGPLVRDAEGNFYGIVRSGGRYGVGGVFEFSP